MKVLSLKKISNISDIETVLQMSKSDIMSDITNQKYEAKSPEAIGLTVLSGIQDFRHLQDLIRTFYLESTQVQELGEIKIFFLKNTQQQLLNRNLANPLYSLFLNKSFSCLQFCSILTSLYKHLKIIILLRLIDNFVLVLSLQFLTEVSVDVVFCFRTSRTHILGVLNLNNPLSLGN